MRPRRDLAHQAATAVAAACLAVAFVTGAGCETRKGAEAVPPTATSSEREYRCRRVPAGAVLVDGDASDPAWREAEPLTGFRTAGPSPEPASVATEARLLWDGERLLVMFRCTGGCAHVAGTRRDDPVWEGEAAEVFLCPLGADRPYFEIDVNPANVVHDSRVLDWRYEVMSSRWADWARLFDADIVSATRMDEGPAGAGRGWTLEAAVPLKDLVSAPADVPAAGTQWLFNVFRAACVAEGKVEFSAWEPTMADFHRPHRFPRLVFVR